METKTLYQKLLEAQKKIKSIKKDNDNPFFKSKYFDINSILAEVKPVLNEQGLVLTQALTMSVFGEVSKMGIKTQITDAESGQEIHEFCEIPTGLDAQKTGSAITYFRRYALQSLLALEAEDDDGNVASEKVVGKKTVKTPADKFDAQLDADLSTNDIL
jgi:hypothetical protein